MSEGTDERTPGQDFWEHLIELRARIIKSLIAVCVGVVIAFMGLERLAFTAALAPLGSRKLMYLGIGEAFTTHLLFSLWLGALIAIPVIAYQMWSFVAPGLYDAERQAAVKLAACSTVLFIAGMAFGYFMMLPVVIHFFLSFESDSLIYGGALGSYLKMVAGILFGAGISFQLPLVIFGLIRSGVISADSIGHQRPYWILGITIVAAILTPTDVLSMIMMAVPMWLLFEAGVFVARFGGVRKKE